MLWYMPCLLYTSRYCRQWYIHRRKGGRAPFHNNRCICACLRQWRQGRKWGPVAVPAPKHHRDVYKRQVQFLRTGSLAQIAFCCCSVALGQGNQTEIHVCFRSILRRAIKGLPNYQLHTVAVCCGYQLEHHHHALADAEACAWIAKQVI